MSATLDELLTEAWSEKSADIATWIRPEARARKLVNKVEETAGEIEDLLQQQRNRLEHFQKNLSAAKTLGKADDVARLTASIDATKQQMASLEVSKANLLADAEKRLREFAGRKPGIWADELRARLAGVAAPSAEVTPEGAPFFRRMLYSMKTRPVPWLIGGGIGTALAARGIAKHLERRRQEKLEIEALKSLIPRLKG